MKTAHGLTSWWAPLAIACALGAAGCSDTIEGGPVVDSGAPDAAVVDDVAAPAVDGGDTDVAGDQGAPADAITATDGPTPPDDRGGNVDAGAPIDAGPATDAAVVGCASNRDCAADAFCRTMAGTCAGRGLCEPRPAACTRELAPVCGCDGRTYANPCLARAAGQNAASRGECSTTADAGIDAGGSFCATATCAAGMRCCESARRCQPAGALCRVDEPDAGATCGAVTCTAGMACCTDPTAPSFGRCYDTRCLACCMGRPTVDAGPAACRRNAECGADQYCASDACGGAGTCAVRPTTCTREFNPVCGCDGRTYGNACTARAAGANVASRGACETGVDAGAADAGSSRCLFVRCTADTTCCARPGSPNDGMCLPSTCLACCR